MTKQEKQLAGMMAAALIAGFFGGVAVGLKAGEYLTKKQYIEQSK